jgi:hypothetical protein
MSTRNGKIARLPASIRTELNQRLQNGEQGESLLEWLNGLPQVVGVMEWWFGGVPINKQSLSQWRQGGYEDWLRHQEAREQVRQMAEEAAELNCEAEEQPVSGFLASMVSLELVRTARKLLEETTDPKERWRVLKEVQEQLTPLRRQDHRAARLQMLQERWELERDRLEKEAQARERLEACKQDVLSFLSLTESGLPATTTDDDGTGEKADE